MKKIGTVILTALLTGSVVSSYPALAQEESGQVSSTQEEDTTNYINFTGVITEIENDEKAIKLTVENQDEMIMILSINDESLLFNSGSTEQLQKTDLKKGETVTAYYDKNKPMILIYPAQVTPEIVIVKNDDLFGEVKISKFNKELTSFDNELKLNINEDTILVNEQGEEIEEKDLQGKDLAVFYTTTTRSIPAQTTPSKIIALDYVTEEMAKLQEIIDNDHYMKNGTKMIPLRKVAEHLGYHVESQPKLSGALVTKQNRSFTVVRGNKEYGYNRSLRYFEEAPELKEKKTYVSIDFLEMLLED
ncbi:copper amine oxidase N-terminal domain-containing protein [Bacillus sp. FJAT-29790]|uniref:stalk domain-containing protein n=1 Tax=Bacillus sp. FJAT-29790 TaxID=1895002 RepID=UPI001C22FB8E|nr:stalk domain-containing protein [Bacillus sp. FJAT-29790]MBU8880566.1 copper amine oxidase N-terminal domain-containing protein [Bacillus sp. FJAT-29790]